MNERQLLLTAITAAFMAHEGQYDKAGVPFIHHILRVGTSLSPDTTAMFVGYLHDVVEDSNLIPLSEIRDTFGDVVADAVDAMTRRTDENYWAYLDRLAQNPLARKVKLADLRDNLLPERQTFEGAESLMRRHQMAYNRIMLVENSENGRAYDYGTIPVQSKEKACA